MAQFPKLRTGAVLQYPGTRQLEIVSEVMRFVDGSTQSFRVSAPRRRWEIRLDALDEGEIAAIEQFFVDNEGDFGSFAFTDPWDGTEHADCSLETGRLETVALGEMRSRTSLDIRENRTEC
jgi:hypothetical protein